MSRLARISHDGRATATAFTRNFPMYQRRLQREPIESRSRGWPAAREPHLGRLDLPASLARLRVWTETTNGSGMLVISERGMYYEEKGIDGWLWWRRTPDGPWEKAFDQQMIARMRKALAMVVEAADYPEHKRSDPEWLRGALLAAKSAALLALGR